jgi:hypothetical protein
MNPSSPLKVNDVSEEHIAFIFRVEELAEQETNVEETQILHRLKLVVFKCYLEGN